MTLPIKTNFPPPSNFGIKKLETAGKKTSVIPLIMPGMDKGKVTFKKVCTLLAPKSAAACI